MSFEMPFILAVATVNISLLKSDACGGFLDFVTVEEMASLKRD